MQLATQNNVRSIAFLNISTGNYHFLKDTAAKVAIRTVKDFLSYHNNIERVTFVCVDDENYNVYPKLSGEELNFCIHKITAIVKYDIPYRVFNN